MKQRTLRSVAWRPPRAVPIQPLEIEHARSEPEHPELDRPRHDARRAGDARQRDSVDEHLPDGIQNHVDARHLSGQRLERKYALAVPTIATTRERHLEHHGRIANVEPALDAAPSKS